MGVIVPQHRRLRISGDYGDDVSLPSVLLHDHLDGGLRPRTVLELAEDHGYEGLPATDETSLAAWFDQSESGSLEGYLKAFDHTIAVMQIPEALERVAYEAVLDLAADEVVYAEFRFCPSLFTDRGLQAAEVIDHVASGLRLGEAETGLKWGIIVDALRQLDNSMEMARAANARRSSGVVGFDLAGPEAPFPPTDHLAACRYIRESGLRLTLHAGEAAGDNGVSYIASAMDVCAAERLGHGVEIVRDCVFEDGDITALGAVASRVRDRQVPLELCPTSNLATNMLDPGEHPLGALFRAGFNVTLNTDNRLMSHTSMSNEFDFARVHHGLNTDNLAQITKRSLEAAFCDYETKRSLWETRIAPSYSQAGAEVDTAW